MTMAEGDIMSEGYTLSTPGSNLPQKLCWAHSPRSEVWQM